MGKREKPSPISKQSTICALLKLLKSADLKPDDKENIRFSIKKYVEKIEQSLNTSGVDMRSTVIVTTNGDIKCMGYDPKTLQPRWNYVTAECFKRNLQCIVSPPDFLEQFFHWDWNTPVSECTIDNLRFALEDGSWIVLNGRFSASKAFAYLELYSEDDSLIWKLKTEKKNIYSIHLGAFFYGRDSTSSNSWFHRTSISVRFARDILVGMKNAFIQMMRPDSEVIFSLQNVSKIPTTSFTTSTPNILAGLWLTPFRVAQGQPGFYEECGFYNEDDILNVKRITRVSFRRMPNQHKIHKFRSEIKKPLSKKIEKQFWTEYNVSEPFIEQTKKMVV